MKNTFLTIAALTAATALAGCATVEEGAVQALGQTQKASLSGSQVVGSAGDPDGSAMAQISVSQEAGQVCYEIREERNIGAITGVSLNRGAPGQSGSVALTFRPTDDGDWKGCTGNSSDALERDIDKSPSLFYVQLTTTDYPNGALRGQLRD